MEPFVVVHVSDGIQVNQETYSCNHQHEDRIESVCHETEISLQASCADPAVIALVHAIATGLTEEVNRTGERYEDRKRSDPAGSSAAQAPAKESVDKKTGQWGQQNK